MSQPIVPSAAIDYPSGDGKPMAENDAQLHAIHYAFGALRLRYATRPDVYVSADLLIDRLRSKRWTDHLRALARNLVRNAD